jgi:hypothetical protein
MLKKAITVLRAKQIPQLNSRGETYTQWSLPYIDEGDVLLDSEGFTYEQIKNVHGSDNFTKFVHVEMRQQRSASNLHGRTGLGPRDKEESICNSYRARLCFAGPSIHVSYSPFLAQNVEQSDADSRTAFVSVFTLLY